MWTQTWSIRAFAFLLQVASFSDGKFSMDYHAQRTLCLDRSARHMFNKLKTLDESRKYTFQSVYTEMEWMVFIFRQKDDFSISSIKKNVETRQFHYCNKTMVVWKRSVSVVDLWFSIGNKNWKLTYPRCSSSNFQIARTILNNVTQILEDPKKIIQGVKSNEKLHEKLHHYAIIAWRKNVFYDLHLQRRLEGPCVVENEGFRRALYYIQTSNEVKVEVEVTTSKITTSNEVEVTSSKASYSNKATRKLCVFKSHGLIGILVLVSFML